MKSDRSRVFGYVCFAGIGCISAAAWAQSGQATRPAVAPIAVVAPESTPAPLNTYWAPAVAAQEAAAAAFGGRAGYSYAGQVRSSQLALKFVKAEKASEKDEAKKQLVEELAKEFDEHLKQQQKEIEDLDKQLATLKATLKKRQDNKTTIVDRRFEQLIQEADGLGWNAPRGSRIRATSPAGGGGGFGASAFPAQPSVNIAR